MLLCAKFKKNSPYPSQAKSAGVCYGHTEIHLGRCLKQKSLEMRGNLQLQKTLEPAFFFFFKQN